MTSRRAARVGRPPQLLSASRGLQLAGIGKMSFEFARLVGAMT